MFRISLRVLLPLLLSLPLLAQTSTGEIDITVLDPSGAVVPNADITVTGSETGNRVRTISTNAEGLAAAPLLQPESYDVAVTAVGFEKLVNRRIVVRVGDVLNLRLVLKAGSLSESVDVVGQTPLLEEKSVTLGQVIEHSLMVQLPLNGQSYLDLGRLAAGAIPSQGSRDQTFSAYGNSGLQNAFLLDGARNENYLRGLDNRARDMLRPPIDALSEFQVQTSNYSAEFGASAGAVVSAITRSGTNQWHGSAYDFLRNDRLDAANFFAQAGYKPLLVQNQYGGSVGAPVKKDRAWVFGAYEGTHTRSESVGIATLPTLALRQGNFGSTAIYDPLSTAGSTRTQFPGNAIPASRFDKVGQQLLDYYPLPNLAGTANNFNRNVPQLQSVSNGVVRGDIQVREKDSMFVRGSVTRLTLHANSTLPEPAQESTDRTINSEGIGYGYTRTFSSTLVNEFRFSWARLTIDQDELAPLNEIVKGALDPRIQHGIPAFNVTGYAAIGAQPGVVGNSPLTKSSGVWDISDNVSKSWRRHQFKFGTDVQVIRPSTFSALNGRGAFGFTGIFAGSAESFANGQPAGGPDSWRCKQSDHRHGGASCRTGPICRLVFSGSVGCDAVVDLEPGNSL